MSELIHTSGRKNVRWQLLSTVSALALIAFSQSQETAKAEESDRPTVWVELGGHFERADSTQAILQPAFFTEGNPAIVPPLTKAQQFPPYTIGGEAKLTFTPEDSNWLFSAGVRYGRSNARKHLHYQSNKPAVPFTSQGHALTFAQTRHEFGDGQSNLQESHFIADFRAGKDVGLGLFGRGGTSVLSAGVRIAQFTSHSDANLHARPTYVSEPLIQTHSGHPVYNFHFAHYHRGTALIQARRDTQAVGPSVSWDASSLLAGSDNGTDLAFDWGVNAALMFGRQRARVHHQTTGSFHSGLFTLFTVSTYHHGHPDQNRSRMITIPNVGGFAGVSFKYANAKIAFGYRADFFFNAMDSGIDVARKENVGFYGPFATISVGLGG